MKVKLGTLRKMIREDYLKGVPEFLFHDATADFVAELRKHITRYILQHHSDNPTTRDEAIKAMHEVLLSLEEEVNASVEDKLYEFVSKV